MEAGTSGRREDGTQPLVAEPLSAVTGHRSLVTGAFSLFTSHFSLSFMPETRRSNIIIVTGTDTGVGKTWVTAALARALPAEGKKVIAIKAVETGCGAGPDAHGDGELLAAATGQPEPRRALECFRDPVSAALAAEREGRSLDFDDLLLRIERYADEADILLIEGIGGLLSPLAWDWCLVDVAQALEARAVVVASDHDGVISHTLLTLGALELASVPVIEVVLTTPERPDETSGTNADAIRKLSGVSSMITLPRSEEIGETAGELGEVARKMATSNK